MVLVTGATGLLGAALTRDLVARGQTVRILRRPTSTLDLLGDAADRVEHAVGDVTNALDVEAAMADVRHVYHAAGLVRFGGPRQEEQLWTVNVQGTAHVVDAALAHGVERLVHISSIAALGRPEPSDVVIDEAIPWVPSRANTAYARSKHDAGLEVFRGCAEGLDAVVVSPAVLFGVGRSGENTWRLVERLRDGKLPAYPAGGTCVVDVLDLVDGLRRALDRGRTGERYLLGGDNLSWQAIFDTLADALGVEAPTRRLPPALGVAAGTIAEGWARLTGADVPLTRALARSSARTYRYSNAKAVAELGCTFRPFAETAARLAAAARGA